MIKIEISKKELEDMYIKLGNVECAKKLEVTSPTLIRYLKKSGIKLKGKGNRTKFRKGKLKING